MVKEVKKVMQTKQVSVAPVRRSSTRKVLGDLHYNVNDVNLIKALNETETEAKVCNYLFCHLSSF